MNIFERYFLIIQWDLWNILKHIQKIIKHNFYYLTDIFNDGDDDKEDQEDNLGVVFRPEVGNRLDLGTLVEEDNPEVGNHLAGGTPVAGTLVGVGTPEVVFHPEPGNRLVEEDNRPAVGILVEGTLPVEVGTPVVGNRLVEVVRYL